MRNLVGDNPTSSSQRMKRRLLSGFFVLHFTALILGNLPWSPFIARLYPTYSWYLRLTGQLQDWGMYAWPDHTTAEIKLTAYFDDDRLEPPWGDASRMSPRRLYVLEALLMRGDCKEAAHRFLHRMMNRYPEDRRPERIELLMDSLPTYGFDAIPPQEPPFPLQTIYEVSQ